MMRFLQTISLFALTLAISLLTGCAQTAIQGEQSSWGLVQPYESSILPIPSPPLEKGSSSKNTWAAIAYTNPIRVLNDSESPVLLGIGLAQNYATAKDAQQAALQNCNADGIAGCEIKAVFTSQCMAFAYDHENLVYAWSIHSTQEDSQNSAMQGCSQQSQGNACATLFNICPRLAGQPVDEPFAQTNPEDAALLTYTLAVFARQAAQLRDQGVSFEEISQPYEAGDEDSGQATLNAFYMQQLQLIYGPYKNFSPEQIYRTQMFSILYDMM